MSYRKSYVLNYFKKVFETTSIINLVNVFDNLLILCIILKQSQSLRIINLVNLFYHFNLNKTPLHCSHTPFRSVEARTNSSETTINTGDVHTIGHKYMYM